VVTHICERTVVAVRTLVVIFGVSDGFTGVSLDSGVRAAVECVHAVTMTGSGPFRDLGRHNPNIFLL
jgi:hypothetical protein